MFIVRNAQLSAPIILHGVSSHTCAYIAVCNYLNLNQKSKKKFL
jgi:hypothetical protein